MLRTVNSSSDDEKNNSRSRQALLKVSRVFGAEKLSATRSIQFVSNKCFAYISGCNLILQQIDSSAKPSIQPIKCRNQLKCMAINSDKQQALLADVSDQRWSRLIRISLQNPEKKHQSKSCIEGSIEGLAVSSDARLVAAFTCSPVKCLLVFSYDSLELLASMELKQLTDAQNVKDLSFFPSENKRLWMVGNFLMKIFSYSDKKIRLISTLGCEFPIVTHTWLNKNETICVDDQGNGYIVYPKQLIVKPLNLHDSSGAKLSLLDLNHQYGYKSVPHEKTRKERNQTEESEQERPSTAILVHGRQGAFMSSASDCVFYFENKSGFESFNLSHTLKLRKKSSQSRNVEEIIVDLCLNENQTLLLALTNHNAIYFCNLGNISLNQNRTAYFECMIESLHFESITGVDICAKKSLVAICSLDRSVCLWNYEANICELKQQFDEELWNISIHPSGLYVLLSTKHSLRFMGLYADGLKVIRIFNSHSCTECLFSNDGHMFALALGSIQIYSSVDFNEIGHFNTQELGKINELCFTRNDCYLICCSMAGIICIWNTCTLLLESKVTTKGLSYTGLALHPDQDWLFLISTEPEIRQFQLRIAGNGDSVKQSSDTNGQLLKLMSKLDAHTSEGLTCISISKSGKVIFVGTNNGCLKLFLTNSGELIFQRRAHSNPITKIGVTCFDEILITCSSDGAVVFWEIAELVRGNYSPIEDHHLSDNVLIPRENLVRKNEMLCDLESKIKDYRVDTEFKLRLHDLKLNRKIRELNHLYKSQIEILERRLSDAKREEQQKQDSYDKKLSSIVEAHLDQVKSFEKKKQVKVVDLKLQNEAILNKTNELNAELAEKRKQRKAHNIGIDDKYEEMARRLGDIKKTHEAELKRLSEDVEPIQEFEACLDEVVEEEVIQVNIEFNYRLSLLEKEKHRLQREVDSLEKKISKHEKLYSTKLEQLGQSRLESDEMVSKTKQMETKITELFRESNRLDEMLREAKSTLIKLKSDCEELETSNDERKEMNAALSNKLNPLHRENSEIKRDLRVLDHELKRTKLDWHSAKSDRYLASVRLHSMLNEISRVNGEARTLTNKNQRILASLKSAIRGNQRFLVSEIQSKSRAHRESLSIRNFMISKVVGK